MNRNWIPLTISLGLACATQPVATKLSTPPDPQSAVTDGKPMIPTLEAQSADALFAGTHRALAYSGFRAGQHPDRGHGAINPSRDDIASDLRMLLDYGVSLIRLYDTGEVSEQTLAIIAEMKIPVKVVLGAWLRAEVSAHETCAWLEEPIPPETLAENRAKNEAEVQRVIGLANRYPEVVVAVNVGNEALVTWNDHLVPIDRVVGYIERVKAAIEQPVSTADNYLAWVEHGERLMTVADFAMIHTYPIWEEKSLEESIPYTRANLLQVRKALPNARLVIGEAGWPSIASEFGDRASEAHQAKYVSELLALGEALNITVFVFEAFDEDWKGNDDPAGAEKHWGLFDIDRRPKLGVRSGQLLGKPAP